MTMLSNYFFENIFLFTDGLRRAGMEPVDEHHQVAIVCSPVPLFVELQSVLLPVAMKGHQGAAQLGFEPPPRRRERRAIERDRQPPDVTVAVDALDVEVNVWLQGDVQPDQCQPPSPLRQ